MVAHNSAVSTSKEKKVIRLISVLKSKISRKKLSSIFSFLYLHIITIEDPTAIMKYSQIVYAYTHVDHNNDIKAVI